MPTSILASMGSQYFQDNESVIDPVISKRIASGLHVKAYDFLRLEENRQKNIQAVNQRLQKIEILVTPTAATTAPKLSEFDDPAKAMELALGMTQYTQPANYLQLCAVSIPAIGRESALPIGIQLLSAGGNDLKLLEIACLIEALQAPYPSPKQAL